MMRQPDIVHVCYENGVHDNRVMDICVSKTLINYSRVGRGRYRASPGNILLIGITRSVKIRRKRFAMLACPQNVPSIIFMQMSTAIIEQSNFQFSQPILQITDKIRSIYLCYEGQRP